GVRCGSSRRCPQAYTAGGPRRGPWSPAGTCAQATGLGLQVEQVRREARLGVGDPELSRALVRGREQPADPTRDRVLRQGRVREPAELLERGLLVGQAQLARLAQVPGAVVAADPEGTPAPRPRLHPGPCRTT